MWRAKPKKYMRNQGKTCKFPGCEFKAKSKGYCKIHYNSINKKKNDLVRRKNNVSECKKTNEKDGKTFKKST